MKSLFAPLLALLGAALFAASFGTALAVGLVASVLFDASRAIARSVARVGVALLLFAVAGAAMANQVLPLTRATGTITTQNLAPTGACTVGSCVEVDVSTAGSLTVQVTGTYTAAGGLSAQVTTDGTTWVTLGGTRTFVRLSNDATAATIGSGVQDVYQVAAVTGARRFRVTALGAVSGAATVTLQPALAAPAGSATITGGGDATAANQVAGNSSLAAIDGKLAGFDADTGAGTQTVTGVILRTPASGGSVEAGTATAPLRTDPTGTTAQPVTTLDGAGNSLTSALRGTERALSVQIVDASGNQVTSFGGAGGTASTYGSAVPASGTAAGFSDGTNMRPARVFDTDTGAGTEYTLGVNVRLGASGGGVELAGGAGAVSAGTLRTTQASDSPLVAATGATGDAACGTDNGTCSIAALLKRNNQNLTTLNTSVNASNPQLPAALGPAAQSGSLSVTPHSDATSAAISVATATTVEIVPLTASQKVRVMAFSLLAAGTGNIKFVHGTGTNCGTGTTDLTGNYNLTAQVGLAMGGGFGPVLVAPAGQALCVTTSASVQMSGHVTYVKY